VGREISYCTSCGDRLLGQEGRGYCAACRPSSAPQPPAVPVPTRRQSSARLRQQPPARPRETTRIRKRSVLPLLLGAAAVLALAIGIAIAAGGSSSPPAPPSSVVIVVPPSSAPAPKAPAGPTLDETLAQIREIRGSDLLFERREEIVRMLKDAGARAGSRLEEVDQIAADYDRKYEEAAARLADFTRSEALRMASKQKFTEALERLDGYPSSFRTSKSAEALRLLKQDLERRRAESTAPPPAPSSPPPKRVL
jgi:hypothetical protein